MSPKYRFLLAFLLTLAAIYTQVALGQTKKMERVVTVPDAATCNCTLAITQTITNSSLCNRNDGAILIAVSGGTGGYVYAWKNQGGDIIGTSKNLTNVLAGSYYLELQDTGAPSCGTLLYGFTVSSSLAITAIVQDNDACTTANGSITPTVTGGSGNYGFSWKLPDGSATQNRNLSNAKAGSYVLTVDDLTLGCTVTKTITVRSRNQLSVTVNTLTGNSSCIQPNGQADITIVGGSGQYQYYWYDLNSFGVVSAVQDLQNVKGGNFSVFVMDQVSGCSGYAYVTIPNATVAPQFSLRDVVPNTACGNTFNGSAKLEISGTPGPYQVSWTDGFTVVATGEAPTGLAPDLYGFTITDTQTQCATYVSPLDPDALWIEDTSPPALELSVDAIAASTRCDTPNGSVSITVKDPLVPYSFAWTGPANFTSSEEDLTGLLPGQYILTITAACNLPPVIEQPDLSISTQSLQINLLDFISDPDGNLNPNSFEIIAQPLSQATATITADHYLNIDYLNTNFTGTDNLRIRACDWLDACTENSFSIHIASPTDGIIVYNAVAPHSYGDNKFMRILNLPDGNKVSVFNRWGDLVFNAVNYNDETPGKRFEGYGPDGKSLPTGTYFYKIEFSDGRSEMTGFLALKQ